MLNGQIFGLPCLRKRLDILRLVNNDRRQFLQLSGNHAHELSCPLRCCSGNLIKRIAAARNIFFQALEIIISVRYQVALVRGNDHRTCCKIG